MVINSAFFEEGDSWPLAVSLLTGFIPYSSVCAFVTTLSHVTDGYWDSVLSRALSWTLGGPSGDSDTHPIESRMGTTKVPGGQISRSKMG